MIRDGEAAGRPGVDVVAPVGDGRRRVAVRPLQAVTHDALADREGVPAIIQDVGAIGRRVRVERGLGDGRLPEVLNRATTVAACSVPVEGAVADREPRVVVDGAATRTFVGHERVAGQRLAPRRVEEGAAPVNRRVVPGKCAVCDGGETLVKNPAAFLSRIPSKEAGRDVQRPAAIDRAAGSTCGRRRRVVGEGAR